MTEQESFRQKESSNLCRSNDGQQKLPELRRKTEITYFPYTFNNKVN